MQWSKVSPYCIVSGDYTIAKCMHRDGWRYEPHYQKALICSIRDFPLTADEAKRVCEGHAARYNETKSAAE